MRGLLLVSLTVLVFFAIFVGDAQAGGVVLDAPVVAPEPSSLRMFGGVVLILRLAGRRAYLRGHRQ